MKILKNIRRLQRHYSISSKKESSPRVNGIDIQMLSERLHSQLFSDVERRHSDTPNADLASKSIKHLKTHNLWDKV